MPVSPKHRVAAVYVAVAGPEQPAEYATAGVAEPGRGFAGSVASAMPASTGYRSGGEREDERGRGVVVDRGRAEGLAAGCTTVSVWLVTPFAIR